MLNIYYSRKKHINVMSDFCDLEEEEAPNTDPRKAHRIQKIDDSNAIPFF